MQDSPNPACLGLVPSLTTLKLVQDSPPDYHSQTGALIVGDPVVGKVTYKGMCRNIEQLSCARKEAEMIGRLLGITPLIGHSATKHSVLQAINSVSLIHIATHGDAKRGEITLSPKHPTLLPPFPREEDYLLTMADISKTRLRAKLVVISCCHSARGQTFKQMCDLESKFFQSLHFWKFLAKLFTRSIVA